MSHSATITVRAEVNGTTSFDKQITETGDVLKVLNTEVTAGETETKQISGDESAMVAVCMATDYPVSIKTYDADDVLQDTITLAAGEAFEWHDGSPYSNLITSDFAYLTIEETGGENDATVTGYILESS